MKSIAFLRHGVSSCEGSQKLNAKQYRDWLKQYDETGIIPVNSLPEQTRAAFRRAKFVISSDLKRAVDSLTFLDHLNKEPKQLPLLREASIPAPILQLPYLKAKPGVWNVMMRLLWLAGYTGGIESYHEAKVRAREAAFLLDSYAEDHNHVFVAGHGFFNRMVGKQLKSQGWHLNGKHYHAHWSCTVYEKN